MSDTPLVFFEEKSNEQELKHDEGWKILVVDDDQDVHSVTEFVMHGVSILGQGLKFLHAYSAAEAKALLYKVDDIAVILLDVVMESEDAGLTLVKTVREELGYQATRIILRTGQPGYAPEYEAIRDYDINDYRTKSELSYARLLTSLTAAIRSYVQIKTIAETNRGLEYILQSAPELLSRTSIDSFAAALSRQMQGLINLEFDTLLFIVPENNSPNDSQAIRVIHTTGKYNRADGQAWPFELVGVKDIDTRLRSCLSHRETQFSDNWACIFIAGTMGKDLVLYLRGAAPITEPQRKIMEVFSVAVSMGYQNMLLLNQLRTLAFQDSTTGLLNRTGFIGAIDQIRSDSREGQVLGLLDIEGFSEINEVLGHDFGDDLLLAVAEHLSECFDETVVCARVSADGFALLGPLNVITPEKIFEIFAKSFTVQQHELYLRIMVGLVKLDEVAGDGADMIKDAFIAVKIAKIQQQSRFYYYNSQFEIEARKKLDLLDDLQRSLDRGGLELYYQPQVDMISGKVTGLEALIRWRRENGEFVSPANFIPLAEQSGLIVRIGDWVLHQACKQVLAWQEMKLATPRVAVNISMRQFNNPGFLVSLDTMFKHYGLSQDLFELEITESMAMHDVSAIITLMRQLKDLGFYIAIDDFGTGFSSLSYLQQLPIDRLKIDRSFVMAIHEAPRSKDIAELIVGISKSLGLSVIAEGVEVIEQSKVLTQLGCFEAQGYLYAKPMDVDSVTKWLIQKNSTQGAGS